MGSKIDFFSLSCPGLKLESKYCFCGFVSYSCLEEPMSQIMPPNQFTVQTLWMQIACSVWKWGTAASLAPFPLPLPHNGAGVKPPEATTGVGAQVLDADHSHFPKIRRELPNLRRATHPCQQVGKPGPPTRSWREQQGSSYQETSFPGPIFPVFSGGITPFSKATYLLRSQLRERESTEFHMHLFILYCKHWCWN